MEYFLYHYCIVGLIDGEPVESYGRVAMDKKVTNDQTFSLFVLAVAKEAGVDVETMIITSMNFLHHEDNLVGGSPTLNSGTLQ